MPIDEAPANPNGTPLVQATVSAKHAGEGFRHTNRGRLATSGPDVSPTALTASTAAPAQRGRIQTARRQHGWHSLSMTT